MRLCCASERLAVRCGLCGRRGRGAGGGGRGEGRSLSSRAQTAVTSATPASPTPPSPPPLFPRFSHVVSWRCPPVAAWTLPELCLLVECLQFLVASGPGPSTESFPVWKGLPASLQAFCGRSRWRPELALIGVVLGIRFHLVFVPSHRSARRLRGCW